MTTFPAFPDRTFPTIAADPPWPYEDSLPGDETRGAVEHYETLPVPTIAGLGAQVRDLVPDKAHCYLWTTGAFIDDAVDVLDMWGFDHKQTLTWVKVNSEPPTLPHERQHAAYIRGYMGMGQYYRNSTEFLLFGTRGNKDVNRQDLVSVFNAEPTDHSRKPDKAYRLIEQASDGPYFEMFSRSARPGWVTWGDEAEADIDVSADPSGKPTTRDAGAW